MKSILRIFSYPFQGAPLLLVIIISLLLVLAFHAGFFGIPLASILIIWFFKYCFRVADASAMGEEVAPILEYEDIFPFHELRPLKLLVVIALYGSLFYFLGDKRIALVGVLILLPAMVWALITEDSFVAAVNPLRLFLYMYQVGLQYILSLLLLGVTAYIVSLTVQFKIGLALTLMIFLFVLILLFHFFGLILHKNRDFLGFEGRSRQEQWAAWDEWQDAKDKSGKLNHWYMQTQASKYDEVIREIRRYIAQRNNETQDFIILLAEIWGWEKKRLAEMLSADYVEYLLKQGDARKAVHYYKDCFSQNRHIRLENENTILQLSDYAKTYRDYDVMLEILNGFEEKFPESSETANVIKTRARVICFELHECKNAYDFLNKMQAKFSWLPLDAEFNGLYQEIHALQEKK